MYFCLHSHCRLVEGVTRGAIYDLHSHKVYSINSSALLFLKACREHPLEEIMDMHAETNPCWEKFIEELNKKQLGTFSTEKKEQEEALFLPATDSAPLEFIWLEITDACNNRCLHCYTESSPARHSAKVTHPQWLNLISQARQLGARELQLIGGEPLLYDRWRDLVIKARTENYEYIEIFTNATLISDNCIEFFKQHHVHVATTIYADNAEIHDQITTNPGSFMQTMSAIEKIRKANIPLRIASILMKPNEDQYHPIMKLCAKLGVDVNPPDIIRPTGRGQNKELLPVNRFSASITPPFYTDSQAFCDAQKNNPCLRGKLAVTSDGDVIPCIFARNRICGNILEASLGDIFRGNVLQQSWHTTKDCLEKCRDCEYRYACSDCRPLAQALDSQNNWYAATCRCSYDPYSGLWSNHTFTEIQP